jgi:uncharacterized protein
MIVDLLSVGTIPIKFEFSVGPGEVDLESDRARIVGGVRVTGELSRNPARTEVFGSIRAPLEVDCTRCLAAVRCNLDIDFQVDFVGLEMFPESKETQLESGDMTADVLEGNKLDLTAVAREQILLNIPEQGFCRIDCKGICPTCGKDLNQGPCNCGEDEIDPRWAGLKNLTG